MRGFGFGVAGVVVVVVVFGAATVVPVGAAVGAAVEVPLPAAELAPVAGVALGVAAGKVVIGVGKGGNGLVSTAAISSVRPASD